MNPQLYRQMAESTHAGIWLISPEGITLYVNPRFAGMLGYPVKEMIGRSFFDFMDEEGQQEAKKNLTRRQQGIEENHDFKFIKKDGSILWALISTNPLYDEEKKGEKKMIGALAVVLDITERKRNEQERTELLSRSRAFLDSLVENIPLLVFVKDAKDLRFIRFNRTGAEILGYSSQELIGKNDFDFFPPEQAKFFIEKDRAVLRGKEIVDISEEPIQTRHRGVRILHTKKIPLFDENGKPEYLLGISEDITEKKQAEEFRQRQKQTQQAAFFAEASDILASSLNYHDSLKALSQLLVPTICDWCTISILREDKTFERVSAVHHQPDKKELMQELLRLIPVQPGQNTGLAQVVATGKSHLYSPLTDEQLRFETSSEEHFQLLKKIGVENLLVVPIVAHQGILGVIAFFLSDSKRLFTIEDQFMGEELGRRVGMALENSFLYDAARKAIEIRDEFLSIASHELKTPITSLRLQLQTAQRQFLPEAKIAATPERIHTLLTKSIAQVDRLTHLIEDLLDVSRIQAGKVSFNLQPMNLSELVDDVVERYVDPLKTVGCAVKAEVEKNIYVTGDRDRLEQVLVNLISNVMKYAPGSPLSIHLSGQTKTAALLVKDQGKGMTLEQQQHIFERFGRATSSRNISGLGLGLYISKEIIAAHHGQIRVKSAPGEGSAFTVTLPVSIA